MSCSSIFIAEVVAQAGKDRRENSSGANSNRLITSATILSSSSVICHLLSLVQTVTGLGDRVLLLVVCCLSNTSSLARHQVWISSRLWFFDAGRRVVVGQRLDADHLHPCPGRLLDHIGLPCGGQIFRQPGSSCQACPWLVLPCLLWSARSFLLFLTIFSPKM